MYHKIQIKFDYGEIDIYCSWIMALFLLEDRDFKGFWMEIWNAGVSVITRSTFSSFLFLFLFLFLFFVFFIKFQMKIFYSENVDPNETKLDLNGLWVVVYFQKYVQQPCGWHYRKIKKSLIDHCSFILSKNELEFKLQLHDNARVVQFVFRVFLCNILFSQLILVVEIRFLCFFDDE